MTAARKDAAGAELLQGTPELRRKDDGNGDDEHGLQLHEHPVDGGKPEHIAEHGKHEQHTDALGQRHGAGTAHDLEDLVHRKSDDGDVENIDDKDRPRRIGQETDHVPALPSAALCGQYILVALYNNRRPIALRFQRKNNFSEFLKSRGPTL